MSRQVSEGVSILLAMYNGSKFIAEQLESILSQSAAEDEILVLDDCSTDRSYFIAKEMEGRHTNLKIMRNDRNLGVVRTFEVLLGVATKNIIFLSDQDDIWIDGRKLQMLCAIEEYSSVAVLANACLYVDGTRMQNLFVDDYPPNTNSIARNFIKNNFIGCCLAFRREVLTLALPFPTHISMHDWWLGTCAMAMGHVTYSYSPAIFYRRHSANFSPGMSRKTWPVAKDRFGNLMALCILAQRAAMFKLQRNSKRYA